MVICKDGLNGQDLTKHQQSFLNKNVHTICNDEIISKADWQPITTATKDKRIVLLGEPNHGSKEIFELRNDLIRFLHNKAGFNTVLFESGIGELAYVDIEKTNLTAAQMTHGFFGGWRTREFRDLMEYIKSTDISIAGFDVQRTGDSFKQLLNRIAANKNTDTFICKTLEDRYGILQRNLANRNAVYDSVDVATKQLIKDYQLVHRLLARSKPVDTSKAFLFSLRTIINRIDYLQYMLQFVKDGDWHKRWAARDTAMAENIKWLIEDIYKDEKIIVVAHNFHVSRYNKNERVMGAILTAGYTKQMYSVGMFAGAGEYADNAGKMMKMVQPDSATLDIKHIINKLPGYANFLDIPRMNYKGDDWLHRNITVNDTFVDLSGSNSMVLAKQFDGLLFIKKISVPEN